jgi:hypothetical protein
MLNAYQHRVRFWMATNSDKHPLYLVDFETMMSRLLMPTSDWTSEIYNSSEPQITTDTIMTLPMGPPGASRTEFLDQLITAVRPYELAGVTNTYTMKTRDGHGYIEHETYEFAHLFQDPNVHKINSDSKEAGVAYLEENLDYHTARPVNILGPSARNLTFIMTPTYYETPMHNDESHSLVYSLPINSGVKIWMTLSDGMLKMSPDGRRTKTGVFNEIISLNTTIQKRIVLLIDTFPTLRIGILFGGMTIFNPYNQSHSVITYGPQPFAGIGHQIVSICGDDWINHLVRMIISRKTHMKEVLHMLNECTLEAYKKTILVQHIRANYKKHRAKHNRHNERHVGQVRN